MIDFRLVSCMEKVFPDAEPGRLEYAPEGLIGEETAFQAAWKASPDEFAKWLVNIRVESPIAEYIRIYKVQNVPVELAWFVCDDPDYLRTTPGLYPDALVPVPEGGLRLYSVIWQAAYFSICPPDELPAGTYPITVILESDSGAELGRAGTVYTRVAAALPEQRLIHTRWFHNDGLCQYYHVEMFSEEYWRICENFVRAAADMSVNCLLTPVHTPPLDTRVGGERLTCQLVDIRADHGKYTFGFDKLQRWIAMAKRCGIRYFEIAHFFTQWGAAHAPKIVAETPEGTRRIFGWETDATGEEYAGFLKAYIPALRAELDRLGVLDHCLFHISDEPNKEQLPSYLAAKALVADALKGLTIIDALSNIEFYSSGAVEHPVPATNAIKPFLEAKVPGLWTYYCCGQFDRVSNCFIAMPLARERMIGVQLYKYDIAGFLQWGFNFYNCQFSMHPVDPWLTTDGEGFTQAGDCFIVYPGKNGEAVPTLRSKTFAQAVNDIRALQKLEEYIGKDEVMKLVEEGIDPIEFDSYPRGEKYLWELRRKVNAKIRSFL